MCLNFSDIRPKVREKLEKYDGIKENIPPYILIITANMLNRLYTPHPLQLLPHNLL
jgi:hypothetical protein